MYACTMDDLISAGDQVSLRYRPPPQAANEDFCLSFFFTAEYLSSIGFPFESDFDEIKSQNLDQFVFVTGNNERYFHIAMDAIATVQEFIPTNMIYDLRSVIRKTISTRVGVRLANEKPFYYGYTKLDYFNTLSMEVLSTLRVFSMPL